MAALPKTEGKRDMKNIWVSKLRSSVQLLVGPTRRASSAASEMESRFYHVRDNSDPDPND
jgi:hypothetical protein